MDDKKRSIVFNCILLGIYFLGTISIYWYFFSFIGLLIGVMYFIFLKNKIWQINGLSLSAYIGFVTVFIFFFKDFPPLNLAIWFGLGFMFVSPLVNGILILVYKKNKMIQSQVSTLVKRIKSIPTKIAIISKLLVILVPILLWSSVSIDLEVLLDNETRLLWVHASSKVKAGQEFDVTVEAWDMFERLSATYNGRIEFEIQSFDYFSLNEIENPVVELPSPYTFSAQVFGSDIAYKIKDGKDNGRHIFEMTVDTPGIHYIIVKDSVTLESYYSNPVIVGEFPNLSNMILWGDIHGHTEISDGTGTLEHSYYYAREIACLEFAALTEHGEIMLFAPGSIDQLELSTNLAYEPNKFVTFHGIEWTNVQTGHYVCIFSGDQLLKNPILSYMTVPSTDALWDALDAFTQSRGCRALALPHHTTKKSYSQDWTQINPKYVKIAEVTSVHGECLFEQRHELNYRGAVDPPPDYTHGTSVVDAYTMGYRMTMYAAGDNHDGHPGHSLSHTRAFIGHQRPFSFWHTRNEHPYPGGITAVFADNITREGVFSGLENQRIFANSDHGRPLIFFRINNTHVGDGSTLIANKDTDHRLINILLAQDGAPPGLKHEAATVTDNWEPNWKASIEIIKNGNLWKVIEVSSPLASIEVLDAESIKGTSYEDKCIEINGEYFINAYSDNPIDPKSLNTGGYDYYLVRIVCENGRTSYAGPIWVEY